MTKLEKEMLEEIVKYRVKLKLALLGNGNCHNVVYPLKHQTECREDGDCNKCREIWKHYAALEIKDEVMKQFGLLSEDPDLKIVSESA